MTGWNDAGHRPGHAAHRALAEEDAREGSDRSVAAAAGEAGASVYTPGSFSDSGLATLEAYLTRRAGMFVDVVEQLVSLHLQKGDQMSALITGEWCARLSSLTASPGCGTVWTSALFSACIPRRRR